MGKHKIQNAPAVRRLPIYYHRLTLLQSHGAEFISTSDLASYIGLDAIVVRKDLELTGVSGHRGIGYPIRNLLASIRTYLGWDRWMRACLVGAGSLGTALLGFHEFAEYGLNICEVFDCSPVRIGQELYGRLVRDVKEMPQVIATSRLEMAVLCLPASAAQEVAERIVACGIRLLWNFSNTCLKVPADVIVQREVISGGFAELSRKRLEYGNIEKKSGISG